MRCLNPNLPPTLGYAVTCTEDVTTPLRRPRKSYEALLRAVRASPKPAIVVFKALGQDRLRSCHVGDMMCTLVQRLGVAAVVTDGGARDLGAVRERAPGFQLFAAGTVPGGGDYTMYDVGGEVSICGLRIAPGDLLHGDLNGLVSVPRAIAARVPARRARSAPSRTPSPSSCKAPSSRCRASPNASAPPGAERRTAMPRAKRPRLTAKQIAALRRFDSATIANAIETFEVRHPAAGFASLELRCMFPDLPPAVGYALTCTVDSTTRGGAAPRAWASWCGRCAPRPSRPSWS